MTEQSPSPQQVVFANEIGVGFSDNDCQIRFLIQGEPSALQAHVAMTHKTAKLLYKLIQELLEGYERVVGTEIPFDPAKLEAIRKALSEAQAIAPTA